MIRAANSLGDIVSIKAMEHDAQRLKLFTILQRKMQERKTRLTSGFPH
jgi:hypothetical protein